MLQYSYIVTTLVVLLQFKYFTHSLKVFCDFLYYVERNHNTMM